MIGSSTKGPERRLRWQYFAICILVYSFGILANSHNGMTDGDAGSHQWDGTDLSTHQSEMYTHLSETQTMSNYLPLVTQGECMISD